MYAVRVLDILLFVFGLSSDNLVGLISTHFMHMLVAPDLRRAKTITQINIYKFTFRFESIRLESQFDQCELNPFERGFEFQAIPVTDPI